MLKNKNYKVLIVDDHPLVVDAYKVVFNHISRQNTKLSFTIEEAYTCEEAYKTIQQTYIAKNSSLDIALLDLSLPPSHDKSILSGEDIGVKLQTICPTAKILIITAYSNPYRINTILQNLNPDALLIKEELTSEKLTNAITAVLEATPYYTKTALKLLRKTATTSVFLDKVDRRLLYELSIGTPTKDLLNILNRSLSGVEKRKRKLKQTFDVEGLSDKKLILAAKEKGFL